jgi:hypothetical protein
VDEYDPAPGRWFLGVDERGNPHTGIDRERGDGRAWTDGNAVTALVHGATYFSRLLDTLRPLRSGDFVLFTDWRGDADERLGGVEGPSSARSWWSCWSGVSTYGDWCGGPIPMKPT